MTDTTAQLCVEDDTDLRVAANLEKEALRAYARFTYIEGWAELLAFCPDREAHEFEALVVSRKLLPHEIDPTGTAAIAASEALAWMRRVQPLDRLLPLWMPLPPPSRADYSKRASKSWPTGRGGSTGWWPGPSASSGASTCLASDP